MSSIEINKANILNKAAFLKEYLENYSKEELNGGAGLDSDKISEDELVELSEKFEETEDVDSLEDVIANIQDKMDLNSDGEITNDELLKFGNILDEIGITTGELLALYEMYGAPVSSDVDSINSSELEDVNLDEFKTILAKYPKLNELIEEIGYETFFNLIDENSDGVLSSDELASAGGLDEDTENLTYSDIKNLLDNNEIEYTDAGQSVQDELEEIETDNLAKEIAEALNSDTSSTEDTTYSNTSGVSGSSGGSYSSGSSGSSSAGSTSNTSSTSGTTDSTDELSIDELEEQKSEKTAELGELNSGLSAVYDGTDEQVAGAKKEMDDKKEVYEELLASEAETNEEVKSLKESAEENQSAIDENDALIAETEISLNETEQEISSENNIIAGLESQKTALEACLVDAQAITITDDNEEEINSKIAGLQAQISAKESEISAENEKLEALEAKKEELETTLDSANDTKTALEEERNTIETNIANAVSTTTKLALEAYQTARSDFESIKSDRIDDIKDEIQGVQDEIDDIEVKIQELEAEETVSENKITGWSEYNAERGEALAAAAESLYGDVTTAGGYCATGVSQAISKAFGYSTSGNGCDYGEVLSELDDWVEITDEIESVDDLVNLPAGAIVSWSTYEAGHTASNGKYGHVFISDGQGNEISDYKSSINTSFADWGATYRVFLPT